MYSIIKEYNKETLLAENNGSLFVLKRIALDEVETLRRLMTINNQNVVRFYESTVINGAFYAVEEFINGITLKAYVEKYGTLSDDETKRIVIAICNGLSEVHSKGIIHRDINPNNIMLDNYSTVKIIDFGISRIYKPESKADTQILGTQGYAAPEQYGFAQTSSKADIYSLGVLINYLKTGCLPNEKEAEGNFGSIVKKCISIDENSRYNNVEEIVSDILYEKKKGKESKIPGFRKNITWHKWVAGIYYAFLAFLFAAFLTPLKDETTYSYVYYILFVVFLFFVPVFIFTDFLGWSSRWNLTKNLEEKKRKRAPIITGIIYELVTFLIFIIMNKK